MSPIIIVHLSYWFYPNNLVLMFIYFIKYSKVDCTDIKYCSLFIYISNKFC